MSGSSKSPELVWTQRSIVRRRFQAPARHRLHVEIAADSGATLVLLPVPNAVRTFPVVLERLESSSRRCPVETSRYRSIRLCQGTLGRPLGGDRMPRPRRLPERESPDSGFEGPNPAPVDSRIPAPPEPGWNAVDERQVVHRPALPRAADGPRHRFRQGKPRIENPQRAALGRSPDAAPDALGQLPSRGRVSIARDQSFDVYRGDAQPRQKAPLRFVLHQRRPGCSAACRPSSPRASPAGSCESAALRRSSSSHRRSARGRHAGHRWRGTGRTGSPARRPSRAPRRSAGEPGSRRWRRGARPDPARTPSSGRMR